MKSIRGGLSCGVWLVLALVVFWVPVQAQTWGEFFNQKKTQKRYLLQQIAALKVYAGYLKKGYEIMDGGISTVRDITRGEFSLHNAFIGSLKQVSPAIRKDVRVAEIIALQLHILQAFGGIKDHELLSAGDLAYIRLVQAELTADCFADLEELLLVITSGKLEMEDDERLQRLGQVYERMLDKSAFTQDFCGNAAQLIRQRRAGQQEIGNVLRMYHLKE
jgi:hypothetical protein